MTGSTAAPMPGPKPTERRFELQHSDSLSESRPDSDGQTARGQHWRSSMIGGDEARQVPMHPQDPAAESQLTPLQDTNVGYTEYLQGLNIDTASKEVGLCGRKSI